MKLQLLGISHFSNTSLEKDEVRLLSTFADRPLPKGGITLACTLSGYMYLAEKIKEAKVPARKSIQIFSLDYSGTRAMSDSNSKMTPSMVEKSDYVRLTELGKDAYSPIHTIISDWAKKREKEQPGFKTKLIDAGYFKTIGNEHRVKYTSSNQLIADFPEIISLVHEHPSFSHLDAIVYQVRLGDTLEEFMTIFDDKSLLRDPVAPKKHHVKGALSNFQGFLLLPTSVRKSHKMRTPEEIENGDSSSQVA
ncbi:hypothetical protein TUMSATVNIG1_60670 (plasmid) [Vibrio nigripulchritudo]|uniref:hypothetical protein n=1 Tax=Vibrio nigripulchritudo TaxID=28173 RepID=UPI001909BE3E|nr:hypothetical protein [Vibrio nigripulchritudo]BCL74083.1 hypothetical protein VNTUMSATTG_60200 [Vibrio nigripulchritudo]BDU35458.1 hypothetical protein TUMSATVNIG1_60670 [Vibrio nigripulchritudo]